MAQGQPPARVMEFGHWGDGLLQSDQDLDTLWEIEKEFKLPTMYTNSEEEINALKAALDGGKTAQVISVYHAKRVKYKLVLFIACALQVGAKLDKPILEHVGTILDRAPWVRDRGKEQIRQAIKEYRNDGRPYDLGSKGLCETMMGLNSSTGAADERGTEGNTGYGKRSLPDNAGDWQFFAVPMPFGFKK